MKTKIRFPARIKKIKVNIQRSSKSPHTPTNQKIRKWVETALAGKRRRSEVTLRIVNIKESQQLNEKWLRKKGPTNVLSFPADNSGISGHKQLGDIILCAPVISREAAQQGKSLVAHWAHMVIHGTLHLIGYDHIKPAEIRKMENLEIKILASLGYANPYNEV